MKGKIIKAILPNSTELQTKYRQIYGDTDVSKHVTGHQEKVLKRYKQILLGIVAFAIIGIINSGIDKSEIFNITRPEYGKSPMAKSVKVEATYGKSKVSENFDILIKPTLLTEDEKEKRLNDCANQLEYKIKNQNNDLSNVTKDLNLATFDKETGVKIRWASDAPDFVDDSGKVVPIGLLLGPQSSPNLGVQPSQAVTLTANLEIDGKRLEREIKVTVVESSQEADIMKALATRLTDIKSQLSQSQGGEAVDLYKNYGRGTKLEWRGYTPSYTAEILFVGLLILIIVYFDKYGKIDKEIKQRKEQIVKELPEFVDKLVLLLNAGVVVNTALVKMAEDYERNKNPSDKKEIFEELSIINQKMKNTNTSLIEELVKLSERLGTKGLMRLVAIIRENINKGSTLAEKLEIEGELLWQTRKKQVEELGRLADTKLVVPLMVLLCVLIVVTIMPAMVDM